MNSEIMLFYKLFRLSEERYRPHKSRHYLFKDYFYNNANFYKGRFKFFLITRLKSQQNYINFHILKYFEIEFWHFHLAHHIHQHPYLNYPIDDEFLKLSRKSSTPSFGSHSVPCEETCGMATENIDPKRVKRQVMVRNKVVCSTFLSEI